MDFMIVYKWVQPWHKELPWKNLSPPSILNTLISMMLKLGAVEEDTGPG